MPRYIVYACPTGPLADQLDAYFACSLSSVGRNEAHAYPPHVTLTGFFEDAPESVPIYTKALTDALDAARPSRPDPPLSIARMELGERFHGLLVDAPWLEAVTADFARRARSPTRREALRLKGNLHVSLAYGFRRDQGQRLAALARLMVDPRSKVAWEVRLYEQMDNGDWICHDSWTL
ncbi:hypothetical protein DFJ74DRAFT_702855 [Hyaloraphidium curvatum]|nr:hypothetical protein DFJ74DRAFT_702855 [Hyaloraphidium curvatum]